MKLEEANSRGRTVINLVVAPADVPVPLPEPVDISNLVCPQKLLDQRVMVEGRDVQLFHGEVAGELDQQIQTAPIVATKRLGGNRLDVVAGWPPQAGELAHPRLEARAAQQVTGPLLDRLHEGTCLGIVGEANAPQVDLLAKEKQIFVSGRIAAVDGS